MDPVCCVCGRPTDKPLLYVRVRTGFYHRRYSNYVCGRDLDVLDTMLDAMSHIRKRPPNIRQLRMDAPLGA